MKILIADPEPKVRRALTVLLQEQPGWVVVGIARTSLELDKKMKLLKPQVILLDWNLPGLNHQALVGKLSEGKSPVIVAIGLRPEIAIFSRSIGVKYFASKLDAPENLLGILRSVNSRL